MKRAKSDVTDSKHPRMDTAASRTGDSAASPASRQWTRVWRNVLVFGTSLAAAIAVIGAGIGWLAAGMPGVWGALIGAAMAAVFLGITALTMTIGRSMTTLGLAGVLMGGFFVKLILFMAAGKLLAGNPDIHGLTLFFTLVAAVIGTAVTDAVIIHKSRIPYVDA